jgi:hypothetical protein
MTWDVEILDEVAEWLDELDEETYEQVIAALNLLQADGPQLGRPLVDSIHGSTYKNMKELRPGSAGRSEIRILFVFDPLRRAVLLVAGDKAEKWTKWYSKNIPIAEARYREHLKGMGQ